MDVAVREDSTRTARTGGLGVVRLLGPAFVASVAYVDPGNVAANVSAGAQFGFLLVWVLVAANAMAVVVQYLSAKLGIVTGRSLPEVVGQRFPRRVRLAYWGQAELVAAATDLAEVIGGAIALNLLFGLPLVLGGAITGAVSLALLVLQHRRRQRHFEFVITGLLVVLTVGFTAGLFVSPPPWSQAAAGLIPRFDGPQSVLLAASMLGATVMPHVIYLHSSLARDRHGRSRTDHETSYLLRATRWDVVIALVVAGGVNIAMLLLAATNLPGQDGTDTIGGAYAAIAGALGPVVAVLFAVGLLASGLASTSVGAYAGAEIMHGLLRVQIPLVVRRLVTLTPALLLLTTDLSPTSMLVISQVVLSFGIPFALIPLVVVTRDARVMGARRNGVVLHLAACAIAMVIVVLNVTLLTLTLFG
ncbi:Nramp family divalent metal transporter [Cellulosimicrobium funkei]|uniref:Mn(2+) uptake NRAMP transporter MntH n=1 Tax=Cellulosimicrobium funkei TaxID=264251 RepID=A0A4Y8QYB0_9MICO|nr:Nramp family divalent metal transporter [Cellulosimicrobium funkei]TFF04419.1 Mn(2+) uptake NRAMP transporter MntH [Cellulosimicrobium funkei]TGA67916.1 Mn(2+) uptake NRAMP transporter MntH [Cellulosimicrobium terreum]